MPHQLALIPPAPRYWIAVASADHVARGVAGGFMQVCHGKRAPLARIRPAPIRPLLPQLTFITDPQRWGYVFRFGLLSIPEADFIRIMRAMHP